MLKLASFNCGGFRSNFHLVKSLLSNYDIVCIQETLLCDSDNMRLGDVSDKFSYVFQSAVRNKHNVGRCRGGLALF